MLGAASSFSATSWNRLHHCDSASFVTPNLFDSTINVLFLKHPESLNQYTDKQPRADAGPTAFLLLEAVGPALGLGAAPDILGEADGRSLRPFDTGTVRAVRSFNAGRARDTAVHDLRRDDQVVRAAQGRGEGCGGLSSGRAKLRCVTVERAEGTLVDGVVIVRQARTTPRQSYRRQQLAESPCFRVDTERDSVCTDTTGALGHESVASVSDTVKVAIGLIGIRNLWTVIADITYPIDVNIALAWIGILGTVVLGRQYAVTVQVTSALRTACPLLDGKLDSCLEVRQVAADVEDQPAREIRQLAERPDPSLDDQIPLVERRGGRDL